MIDVYFHRLSRPFAILFPILAVIGVIVPILLDVTLFAILGVYIAIPLLFGGLLYYPADLPARSSHVTGESRFLFKTLVAGYCLSLAVAIAILAAVATRPMVYFVVIAIAATLVFVQILTVDLEPVRVGVVLVECAALITNVIWGVTFKYNFFFGRTDVFPHTWYTKELIRTGHVTAAFENYQWFPLWHVLATIERLYIGLDIPPRYLFFLTNGIAYAVLVGGIYLLARELFDSNRIALTAALLTSINTWVLMYGMYSIPRSLVSVLTVFTLITILSRGRRTFVVFLLLTAGIIVYHTVSIPFVLFVLGAFYLVQNAFSSGWTNDPINLRDLVIMGGLQLVYWMAVAGELFGIVTGRLTSSSISGASGVGGTGTSIPNPLHELANYLQFSLLLLFITIALVLGLKSERFSWEGKVAVLSGALLATVSYPGPILLVNKLASNLNMVRFGQYTFPLIVIAGAVGIITLADAELQFGKANATTLFRGLAIVLVLSLAFLAVSNDFVASDNPTIEREFYTYYLTESETTGFETIGGLTDGLLLTDGIACKYVTYTSYDGECTILQTDIDKQRLLTGEQPNTVVVRTTELQRRDLRVFPTERFYPSDPPHLYAKEYLPSESPAWNDLGRRSKVYTSDDISAFRNASQRANDTATTSRSN